MESLSMTVVIIEHKLEWIAEFADRVLALAAGKLVADGIPGQVLADPSLLNYGIGQARYTLAAAHIRELGLWRNNAPLPVTLPAAVNSFQDVITGRHSSSPPR
jgi:ABC-type multidrug transport system ATPase subunit